MELLKPHLLGLTGNCLKGSAPKDFDYASRHTIRQLQQVLDEALIDFHRSGTRHGYLGFIVYGWAWFERSDGRRIGFNDGLDIGPTVGR